MKIQEILPLIHEKKLSIYYWDKTNEKTIESYKGEPVKANIPHILLDKEIRSIGAAAKSHIDIEISNDFNNRVQK